MKTLHPFLFCILTLCIQLYASPVPQTNSTSDSIGPSDEEGNPYEVWGAGNATSVGNQTDAYTGNPYDLWGPGNITAGNNSDNNNNDNTAVGVDFDNTLQAIFLVAMIGILAIIGVGVFVKYKYSAGSKFKESPDTNIYGVNTPLEAIVKKARRTSMLPLTEREKKEGKSGIVIQPKSSTLSRQYSHSTLDSYADTLADYFETIDRNAKGKN
ncbi:hypothetical protein HK103_004609 [Boothiomyces macroporosus]|uniref:Uncharacterized protein n=1 Tax=Boothiomyces macroporosus TaxID=261099 RepID=A0AAD5UGZ2_9FUNG|nr:hypothetical protein HK103_004609 [Boothiomyces macroporosus]